MDTPTLVPDSRNCSKPPRRGRPALETLLERHQAQVYRFGMKMCRDPGGREGRPPGHAARDGPWRTRLSRRVVDLDVALHDRAELLHQEAAARASSHPGASARSTRTRRPRRARLADPATGPDEALAGKQVEQALEQAIAALEPMYREVLLLRDVEGLTAPEVAEVLGVSVQAVKSRLHRARLSVRAHVAPLLGVPAEPAAAAGNVPRRAHTVLAAPRGRDQRRRLRRDGAAPRGLRALPRRVRLAQAHTRPVPNVGPRGRGPARGSGLGQDGALRTFLAGERLNPFRGARALTWSWRPQWRPCR